jgi:hypothetical protein
MKRIIAFACLVTVLCLGVGQSFADMDDPTRPSPTIPPKGIEGPDTKYAPTTHEPVESVEGPEQAR